MHVVHFPVFGGPHNQALRLAGPLATRGFDTVTVVSDEPGNAVDRLRSAGLDVRAIGLHRLRASPDPRVQLGFALQGPREIGRLRALIRAEGVSIVQVGGLVNPHAAIAARLEDVPVVWQLLDTRAPWPVAAAAMMWVRELADVVMSTGMAVAMAHPGYGAIADRVVPFFPPVDLKRFAPDRDARRQVRNEWGVSADHPVVGCVANINPQKGIVELVTGFAEARRTAPTARLVLVGAEYSHHATYSDIVRSRMAAEGLVEGRDVLFLGDRDDVERQLAGFDILALAARPRSEGVTTAVLEAMAAALPVVVTDVGALSEAVDDGRTGFIVAPGDGAGFARSLADLLDHPDVRSSFGENGRRVAQQHFGIETCADLHARVYARALAARGQGHRAVALRRPPPTSRPAATNVDGIPVFLADATRMSHDELGHLHERHKSEQAAHFDHADEAAFETIRPHGSPRLYRYLLGEKFRRAIGPIRAELVGASALTVCGGSGMDAEYLARAGATVVTSDLSIGAAKRAKKRSDLYRLGIQSTVADVERLPYGDRSVDLVAVHDGLHHLEDPYAGLSEMTRVARRWVVVTEPARASLTRVAIRVGFAREKEDSGNLVARMDPSEVRAFLQAHGFVTLTSDRYLMYYPHHPGAVFRVLSHPLVFPIVRIGWRLTDSVVGRFGNKMVVVAERASE